MKRAIALLALLAGCASLEAPDLGRTASPDRVVGESIQSARAPAAEQKAALSRAQAAFVADGNALNRLRLGALLALLPPPLRDDARAAELLEPIADAGSPGIGRTALILQQQVAERQRLTRELERIERAARERQQADRERDKREEALKQQLEALRSIERGIMEREEKLRRKPR